MLQANCDDTFSRRQFLPASAAVKGPRFRRRDWALSAQVREILDEINLPLTPRPERNIDPAESIVLAGNEIFNSMRTGDHVVKQRRTVDFAMLPELAIAEPAAVADDSLRNAAGEALAALNQRRITPARRAVPAPSQGRSLVLFAAVMGNCRPRNCCVDSGAVMTLDKDSIYYSKERYRLIPQRVSEFVVQYLVIDSYENEIVGTHARMADAMAQRDALDPT